MKRNALRTVLGLAALVVALGACASNEPYTAPQQQPANRIPRAPVVAPSGLESPWWWMLPEGWW